MSRFLVRCWCVLTLVPALLHSQTPADSSHGDSVATRHLPLVSGTFITGSRLDSLPIDDPTAAFGLVPGAFLRGASVGILNGFDLSFRGGASGQSAIYVDGAPVRSQIFGTPGITLGTNSIGGVDVVTGVPGAELADARGGLISYVTAAGTEHFTAHWRAQTDEPFGSGSSVGYNRFAGAVGGPLPGITGFTWFLSGTLQGQGSAYLGAGAQDVPTYVIGGPDTTVHVIDLTGDTVAVAVPRFTQWSGACNASTNGADCRGLSRPMDWSTSTQLQGRLDYAFGNGSHLSLTGIANGLQQRSTPGTLLGDPALFQGEHRWSRLAVLNWRQGLGTVQGGAFAFDATMSLATDREFSGALDPASEVATRAPSLGIELSTLNFGEFNGLSLPLTEDIVRNIRSNSGLRVPYLGRSDLNNAQPYRMNPFGMAAGGFYTDGSNAPLAMWSERRVTGRWALTWRPGTVQSLTLGTDLDHSDVTSYSAASISSEAGLDAWTAQPRRFGLFAADRFDWGSVILDFGLRYDNFNPGGELPASAGFTFSNPNWDPSAATSDAAYANSVARVFQPLRSQSFVSPRVRFAVAAGPHTVVRAGIGSLVTPPSYGQIFANSNNDLANTNANAAFGRDVNFAATTTYEGGIHQEFPQGVSADLSGYYESGMAMYGDRIVNETDLENPGRQLTINTLASFPSRDGAGVDASLSWHPGAAFAATLSYSWFDLIQQTTTNAISASFEARTPGGWHEGTVLGGLSRDLSAVVTFRAIDGLSYTPLLNVGSGTLAPGLPGPGAQQAGDINSQTLPWTSFLDLRLAKGVRAGRLDWTIFADVRNLLNFKNVFGLYAETNDVSNAVFQQNVTAAEFANLTNEALNNGARNPDGSVSLNNCANWSGQPGPVNCVMLRRTEARFGNGDGIYTVAEQTRALTAYFNMVYGSSRFYGPQRTVRVGLQLGF